MWRIESIHSNFKQLSKILYFIFLRRCIASENWGPQTTKLLLLLLQSLRYPCLKAKTCNSIYRTWTIREQHKKKHKNAKRMMKKTRGHQSWLALLSFGPVIYPLICALAPCLLAPWAAAVAIHTIQSQKNHHKVINFFVRLARPSPAGKNHLVLAFEEGNCGWVGVWVFHPFLSLPWLWFSGHLS